MERIYLTRRNLLTLLNKLDRVAKGEISACTIVKQDAVHPKYPQTIPQIAVTAVEDTDYCIDRKPGIVLAVDDPELKKV